MDGQAISQVLLDIYQKLLNHYGPQHWWPAEEPFEVIIGAILTQSAAWNNVEKAVTNLKKAGVLTPKALRNLPAEEIAKLIYPSGYYNVKARKLKAFVNWLGERYDDNLNDLFIKNTGDLRSELLSVYGIGEETADSIILYAADKPIFVIDAYTQRFINRRGIKTTMESYAAYQALFTKHLPADTQLFNEYHALLVSLGKDVCRKNPACERCCLNITGTQPTGERYPCSPNPR
jgi:endonuclease-3 related protein